MQTVYANSVFVEGSFGYTVSVWPLKRLETETKVSPCDRHSVNTLDVTVCFHGWQYYTCVVTDHF